MAWDVSVYFKSAFTEIYRSNNCGGAQHPAKIFFGYGGSQTSF